MKNSRIALQSIIYFLGGATLGYFTAFLVPSQTAVDFFKLFGALMAVSGSLLGWSAGWIDQSRKLNKDIDYDNAVFLSDKLAIAQKHLIWRWGVALASALIVVVGSIGLNNPSWAQTTTTMFWSVVCGMTVLSVFSVGSLFASLLASVELKTRLEDYERDQSRRLRQAPPTVQLDTKDVLGEKISARKRTTRLSL